MSIAGAIHQTIISQAELSISLSIAIIGGLLGGRPNAGRGVQKSVSRQSDSVSVTSGVFPVRYPAKPAVGLMVVDGWVTAGNRMVAGIVLQLVQDR